VQNLIDYPERFSPEQSSRNLDRIKCEIDYMTRLVESLLFISSIALQDDKSDQVELADVVAYECESIPCRGKEILYKGPDELPVTANEILLRRMIKNLLDNAVKNAANEVTATLKQDGASTCITVENDGSAVSDKSQYGVKRAHRTVDRMKGIHISMGLGSIIIRKIVEKYHGRVVIEDRDGGGAAISVFINVGAPQPELAEGEFTLQAACQTQQNA
jgi:K+-sensing histidine kinase KdpD